MKILILLFLASCSSIQDKPEIYSEIRLNHTALIGQRLIPRAGYNGHLTNQVCTEFAGKNCLKRSLLKYDMNDESTRNQLVNDLKFACKIGKKRWRISVKTPTLIHQESGCVKWKKRTISRKVYCAQIGVIKMEFIKFEDYQRLIDGALECRSGF